MQTLGLFAANYSFHRISANFERFELKCYHVKFINRTSGRIRIEFTKSDGNVLELMPNEEKVLDSKQLGIVLHDSLNVYFEVSSNQQLDIEIMNIVEIEGEKLPSLDGKSLRSFNKVSPVIHGNSNNQNSQ